MTKSSSRRVNVTGSDPLKKLHHFLSYPVPMSQRRIPLRQQNQGSVNYSIFMTDSRNKWDRIITLDSAGNRALFRSIALKKIQFCPVDHAQKVEL